MSKRNRNMWMWILLIVLALATFALLARMLTAEDDWICDHGTWTRHGQPTVEMPHARCGR